MKKYCLSMFNFNWNRYRSGWDGPGSACPGCPLQLIENAGDEVGATNHRCKYDNGFKSAGL
jgi:hypothetical protein